MGSEMFFFSDLLHELKVFMFEVYVCECVFVCSPTHEFTDLLASLFVLKPQRKVFDLELSPGMPHLPGRRPF